MNGGSWTGYFLTRQTSWSLPGFFDGSSDEVIYNNPTPGVDVKVQFFMGY